MRSPTHRALLAAAALLALGACDRAGARGDTLQTLLAGEAAPQPSATARPTRVGPSRRPVVLSHREVRSIAFLHERVDTNVTLGAWIEEHSGDDVAVAPVTRFPRQAICRTASSIVLLHHVRLTRHAIFAVPRRAGDEPLPAPDDSTDLARSRCRLVGIWLETPTATAADAESMARLLTNTLRDSLGRATVNDFAMYLPGPWSTPWSWIRPATVTALGVLLPAKSDGDSATYTLVAGTYARYRGVSPDHAHEYHDQDAPPLAAAPHVAIPRALMDSALAWADLPPENGLPAVAQLLSDPGSAGDSVTDATLESALERIRTHSDGLPAEQRAAAFLAGDLVASTYLERVTRDASSERLAVFRASGYEPTSLGPDAGYALHHPLLIDAFNANPSGAAAHAAFPLLEQVDAPACGSAAPWIRTVSRLERAIERGYADPGALHLRLARAYHALFTFTLAGDSSAVADSLRHAVTRPRPRAVDEYRAALAALPDSASRSAAWIGGMRALLGLGDGAVLACPAGG